MSLAVCCLTQPIQGESPYILLGPADQLALDQPRIAIELLDPDTGQSLGPGFANTFLLDTGANSVLAVDDSIAELNQNGYRTEGTFYERGVAGTKEFDVSAVYDIAYAGTDGVEYVIRDGRILSSNEVSFCPIPGLCSFYGIAGMPMMNELVTTMDLSSLGGGNAGGDMFGDIFDSLLNVDFLQTTFSNQLPSTNLRRYNIPVDPVAFPPESEGPIPVWVDLPFVSADAAHQGTTVNGNLVLDTGAQLSILSSNMAFELGLDANDDGRLEDDAVGSQPIGGVGGQIDAPLMLVDELRVPTKEGVELVYTNLTVAIVDIDPVIDGIFGMNFLASGWTGSLLGGDLGDLTDLLNDANLGDLLGDLGGLGLGFGDGSPYGFFEQVHFDFRDFENGNGSIVVDLTAEVSDVVFPEGLHGDLDNDGDIDEADRMIWVHDVQNTYYGDTNLDGVFDSKDLVIVFQAGEYEDDLVQNSSWETGDWNGDLEFSSRDLVVAFQDGGFEQGPRAAHSVPEPTGVILLLSALVMLGRRRRSRR